MRKTKDFENDMRLILENQSAFCSFEKKKSEIKDTEGIEKAPRLSAQFSCSFSN